ncbi:MAG: D-aminoacyl-tRNA deacylase [Pseudomonadota bacterium]
MIGLLQRVSQASVVVDNETIASIQQGLLILVGVEKNDTEAQADRLLERLLGYRVFSDQDGKMNLSLQDVKGGLILVSQFTLPANTQKGMRPSFTSAADPETGERLFNYLLGQARLKYPDVGSGQFGAHMQLHLVNDGPVTFWLQVKPQQ